MTKQGDLISREALKKAIEQYQIQWNKNCETDIAHWDSCEHILAIIDNAPTVELEKAKESEIIKAYTKGFDTGVETVKNERPQGEREFIEILAQYVPDDLCTYPEYRGKPYYSIHYKENGEEFVGFGTYNPEVLSRYLKEYFMKGGAE